MVIGIINQTIIGENNTLCTAESPLIINVTLIILAALFLWQLIIVVVIAIAADAHTLGYIPKIAFGTVPTQVTGFVFGDKIIRQLTVGIDI